VSAATEDRRADQDQDDLIGDIIAEVARDHGVAISRDDPVVAVVLLNQVVLRRYLEETVAPAAAAIREATDTAVTRIEQLADAQATWLEQVSLKDRASFLDEQKALHDVWKADMEALIEGQNAAPQRVVGQTISRLRSPLAGDSAHLHHPPRLSKSADARSTRPTAYRHWVGAGLLLAAVALGVSGWLWLHPTASRDEATARRSSSTPIAGVGERLAQGRSVTQDGGTNPTPDCRVQRWTQTSPRSKMPCDAYQRRNGCA
jgi:hypothetical protein